MPEGNRLPGNFTGSQNIMAAFKQDIKNKHRLEMDHLLGRKRLMPALPKINAGKISREPTLAAYVKKPLNIRMTYKGNLYKATVRKDGTIFYKGKVYNSPSAAAKFITGKPSNGWAWWKFQRGPGEWVLLDTLRKK
jgi:hypothetical protein